MSRRLDRPDLGAIAVVFIGGSVGTAARAAVERHVAVGSHWPTATLLVNLLGAATLGIVLEKLAQLGPDDRYRRRLRLFLGTGFCGAFTTYSAMTLEASTLVTNGSVGLAVGYVAATVIGGVAAVWAGILFARRLREHREARP